MNCGRYGRRPEKERAEKDRAKVSELAARLKAEVEELQRRVAEGDQEVDRLQNEVKNREAAILELQTAISKLQARDELHIRAQDELRAEFHRLDQQLALALCNQAAIAEAPAGTDRAKKHNSLMLLDKSPIMHAIH